MIEEEVQIAEPVSDQVEIAEPPASVEVDPVESPVEIRTDDVVETVVEEAQPEVEIPEIGTTLPEVAATSETVEVAVSSANEKETSGLIPDIDLEPATVAAVTGAAAAVATVAGAAAGTADESAQTEMAVPEEIEIQHEELETAPEVPEKLSFPEVAGQPVVETTAVVETVEPAVQQAVPPAEPQVVEESVQVAEQTEQATPAVTVLDGDSLKRHPDYGGGRGGILKRFVNTLRGKDFI